MLRDALPARREARQLLVADLFAAIGQGLTLPFLYIYLTRIRDLAPWTVGLLVGWMGAVGLVLAPVAGTLIDRYGARRVMLPLYAVMTAGAAGLAFVYTSWQALAAVTAIALGGAAIWSGQTTMLASLTEEHERQKTFGLNFTLLNLGLGIGGLASGLLVDLHRPVTFQVLYLLNAVSYAAPALTLLFLPAVGQRLVEPGDQEAVVGGYRDVLADRSFRRFVLFGLVLTTCGYAQIEVGFPAFVTGVAHLAPRVIGFALAANTLTIVCSQLFVLRWIEGRSRSRTLAVVGATFAGSWLVVSASGLLGGGRSLLAPICVVLSMVVFAVGETMLSPVMPAITNALATDALRGRYNAASSMIWGLSSVIGPITAAPLIGAGLGGLWVALTAGGCLGAAGLALSLHRRLSPVQDGRVIVPSSRHDIDAVENAELPAVELPEVELPEPAAQPRR